MTNEQITAAVKDGRYTQVADAITISRNFAEAHMKIDIARHAIVDMSWIGEQFITKEEQKIIYQCRAILEEALNRSDSIAARQYALDHVFAEHNK